jgi:mono/diheme cytochrome c family protein
MYGRVTKGATVRSGIAILIAVASAVASAQGTPAAARGELLYTTHCQGCHTAQIHWRDRKLATDWPGLVAQVTRWQKNANLGWSAEDVDAVARWLNGRYYRLAAPEAKPVGATPVPPRA